MTASERRRETVNLMADRRYATAPGLAEEFHVSRRTIERDFACLFQAGYPILPVQGNGGGYTVMEGRMMSHQFLSTKQEAFLNSLSARLQLTEEEREIAESIVRDFSQRRML